MVKNVEKKFKKVSKKTTWGTIFLFIIIYSILSIAFVGFLDALATITIENKFNYEVNKIRDIGNVYSGNAAKNDTHIYEAIEHELENFFITDTKDNIIYRSGKDTCDMSTHGKLDFDENEPVDIYRDTNNSVLSATSEGVVLDFSEFVKKACFAMKDKGMNYYAYGELEVPMWIKIPVRDGKEFLYARVVIGIEFSTIAFVIACVVISAVMSLLIFIIMICSIISGALKRRGIINMFFMDEVTGRHNQMWFIIKADKCLKRRRNARKKYAVVNVNVVKYRNYCISHSLTEGEVLLTKINILLERLALRREFVAHIASADYAMLLEYTNEEELSGRLHSMIEELEKVSTIHHFAFHLGVELVPISINDKGRIARRKNADIDRLYNNACMARSVMRGSDDSGIEFFDEKLLNEQKWVDKVIDSMQKALDNEEFVVYYQPKYNPKNDKLSGAEALIRWDSPEYGFKGPGEFIPIFEDNGFITKIDHYMLVHVARDQKRWIDAGYKCVPVSVNISRAHFIEDDLAEQIRDAVDAEGAPRNLIEIELTESAFFDDKNAIIKTISKLKEYGFTVSMDDFGSGYSSLNSLKDMPLDVLKLDAEFFRGETDNPRAKIVVSEAIRLAKSLDMKTVAEGVEVKDQVDFLADSDCDMIQGYFYAKPMNGEDFEKRMTSFKEQMNE